MICPLSLPPVLNAHYPSRPDTVSNAPLPLDLMEPESVPDDEAAVLSKPLVKRNATFTGDPPNSKRGCVSNAVDSTKAVFTLRRK